jgi:hypothetical protein
LEEHREVGDSAHTAQKLMIELDEYEANMHVGVYSTGSYIRMCSQTDLCTSAEVRERGAQLISVNTGELAGSVQPKCDELARIDDAVRATLHRRRCVLEGSRHMHERIERANDWCNRSVSQLSSLTATDAPTTVGGSELAALDALLAEAVTLNCYDDDDDETTDTTPLMMTTTNTSTLLAQVAAHTRHVHMLVDARRRRLAKAPRPVGTVSPGKKRGSGGGTPLKVQHNYEYLQMCVCV